MNLKDISKTGYTPRTLIDLVTPCTLHFDELLTNKSTKSCYQAAPEIA
ncbi:hypothetical protein [Aristophania vespae]|nr:hypothetical protein [Aristophania vespae]